MPILCINTWIYWYKIIYHKYISMSIITSLFSQDALDKIIAKEKSKQMKWIRQIIKCLKMRKEGLERWLSS